MAQASYRGVVHSRAKDGTERVLELSAFAIRAADGTICGFVDTKRDITERKRTELELLLGGELVVRSQPRQGSTFTLQLPTVSCDDAAALPSSN